MIGKEAWRFCKRRVSEIENYDRAVSDYKTVWHCHHRKETPVDGVGMNRKELKERNMYYNVSPEELIFLTPKDHMKEHSAYIQRQNKKQDTQVKAEIKGSISFADFINAKNRIVKKYAIWIFRHPENKKELEQQRDKEITDLLDEYEQKERKNFRNMDKIKELGIKLEIKLICKR
jgi:hypothetical protein